MTVPATHSTSRGAAARGSALPPAGSTGDRGRSFVLMKNAGDDSVEAAADDAVEYDDLYRKHHLRVRRLCRLWLSDPDEADDVTQEVFIKLFQALQTEQRTMAWPAWLTRVTVNACRDRRRSGWWKWWRERHADFAEAHFPGNSPTPEQAALSNERRRAVWRCFRELSARQQEVFVLRQLEGWSTDAVAATLGLSAGSVKRHLYRAVHQMRKALGGSQ
jgi:RNA polymerase sigma factor (sigma-70 family)